VTCDRYLFKSGFKATVMVCSRAGNLTGVLHSCFVKSLVTCCYTVLWFTVITYTCSITHHVPLRKALHLCFYVHHRN
jgi:hypothetical protein